MMSNISMERLKKVHKLETKLELLRREMQKKQDIEHVRKTKYIYWKKLSSENIVFLFIGEYYGQLKRTFSKIVLISFFIILIISDSILGSNSKIVFDIDINLLILPLL